MTRAPSVKSVRSLERGLDVLQALQSGHGMGLKALHEITSLPKATLLRILRTLMERNLIWRRMADGAYLPSSRPAARGPGLDDEGRLVEIASPVMARLCETVNWPSVLAVRRGGRMEVIETNRPRSYLPHIPIGPVGARVNMLLTSTGRAYFAFCSQGEREEILRLLEASDDAFDAFARDPAWVARTVAQTQAQGYGRRDPLFAGEAHGSTGFPDDGRNSIAVPVIVSGQVVGALNLTWTRRAAGAAQVVSGHLAHLRDAANEIAAGLEAQAQA